MTFSDVTAEGMCSLHSALVHPRDSTAPLFPAVRPSRNLSYVHRTEYTCWHSVATLVCGEVINPTEEHMDNTDNTESRKTSAVLADIISAMDALEATERDRVLTTLTTYYGLGNTPPAHAFSHHPDTIHSAFPPFGREEKDPKAFFKEKGPKTDVERIACLAFYLANYRDVPFFKDSGSYEAQHGSSPAEVQQRVLCRRQCSEGGLLGRRYEGAAAD